MHQKRLAPGSARTRWGSLSAPPDPLAAVGEDNYISSRSLVPIAGMGEGELMCVEWAEMNERGYFFETRHRQ